MSRPHTGEGQPYSENTRAGDHLTGPIGSEWNELIDALADKIHLLTELRAQNPIIPDFDPAAATVLAKSDGLPWQFFELERTKAAYLALRLGQEERQSPEVVQVSADRLFREDVAHTLHAAATNRQLLGGGITTIEIGIRQHEYDYVIYLEKPLAENGRQRQPASSDPAQSTNRSIADVMMDQLEQQWMKRLMNL